MKLDPHYVYDPDPLPPGAPLASVHSANPKLVRRVLDADEDSLDGRSQWVWVRLPNGDLILGVYPQGATYEACEMDAQFREGKA